MFLRALLTLAAASLLSGAVDRAQASSFQSLPILKAYPEDLTYRELPDATPRQAEPGLKAVEALALGEGLESVGTDETGFRHRILEMDDVFANHDTDQLLIVKFNAQPAQEAYRDKLILEGDDLLYHGQTASGLPFALYASKLGSGASHEFVAKVVDALQVSGGYEEARLAPALKPRSSPWRQALSRLSDLILPSAEASFFRRNKPDQCTAGRVPGGYHDGVEVRRAIPVKQPNKFIQIISNCFKGIGAGIVSATWGAAGAIYKMTIQVGKGIIYTFKHPLKAIANAFRTLAEFPKKLWNFFTNKKDEVKKFDAADWAKILCQIATEVGIGVAIGMIATGRLPTGALDLKKTADIFKRTSEGERMFTTIRTGRMGGM